MGITIVFFGTVALVGAVFLAGASLGRWPAADAGWRAASFSAGFGMIVLGGLAPLGAGVAAQLALVVAAAAQLFVGLSAWRHRRR